MVNLKAFNSLIALTIDGNIISILSFQEVWTNNDFNMQTTARVTFCGCEKGRTVPVRFFVLYIFLTLIFVPFKEEVKI